jgi:hypothetical protein
MCISRFIIPVFVTICLLAASGCIRSYRETRGVTGRLLDPTGKPVGGVPITVAIDDHREKVVASQDGHFDVKPRYKLVLWIAGDWAYGPPVVEIALDGYEPYKTREGEGQLLQRDDYVQLGDVHLRKRQPPSSLKKGP